MKSLTVAALTALLLSGCSVSASGDRKPHSQDGADCVAGDAKGKSNAGLDQKALCITSDGSELAFIVEMARTPAEQSRGLMFREKMPDDRGMLFPYEKPQILSFWMKNTVISLDIIFIAPDGRIERIAANTKAYSLESISSNAPAIAVLEVRGGLAAQMGIKPGDIVKWQK